MMSGSHRLEELKFQTLEGRAKSPICTLERTRTIENVNASDCVVDVFNV